jgi:hypothetical protein
MALATLDLQQVVEARSSGTGIAALAAQAPATPDLEKVVEAQKLMGERTASLAGCQLWPTVVAKMI